ncbi:hypothetical protein SOASR031_28140 [Leminorella grimontii]|nr:hypothetical protein SOASR031_28140 [Leminorella grimontii]
MDGVFGHHTSTNTEAEIADNLISAISAVLRHSDLDSVRKMYSLLLEHSPMGYIDILMEKIPQSPGISAERLNELTVWLATESPDRNAVKCAIALLGFFPSEKTQSLVSTLGLHEEFTLFSAVALCNILAPEFQEEALVGLAKRVVGWGRIQLIERLPDEVTKPTQDWLLREGYSNSVMVEYTAYECATKGKLLFALTAESPDSDLLLGVGDILSALAMGGPARDMYDYADGAQACRRYLISLGHYSGDDLRHLLNINQIGEFARSESNNWDALTTLGWNHELRQEITERVDLLLAQPKWREKVNADLQVAEGKLSYSTIYAARLLNIDPWDTIFAHQAASVSAPEDNWYQLMQTDNPERIARIISLAEVQIDLAAIATGPDDKMGIGPEYRQHGALDFILQGLKRFPGMGWSLIKTGLRSPVVRNRHMALNAIESWTKEQRTEELEEMLKEAYQKEPNEEVRNRLKGMIK